MPAPTRQYSPVAGVGSYAPDQPPGWAPRPVPPTRYVEPDPPRTPWVPHVVLGMVTPLLVLGLLIGGHDALNDLDPDTAEARSLFSFAAFAAFACVGTAAFLASRQETRLGVAFWASAVAGGGALAFYVFIFLWSAYEGAAAVGYVFVAGMAAALWLGLGLTGGILVLVHKVRAGGALALANGVAVAIAAGIVAVLFLMDLEGQAAEARAQHESPAWGLLGAAIAVATVAAMKRMGKRT